MADFISREAAYKTLTEYYHHSSGVQHTALREALNRVPSADVRPVVRGEWKCADDEDFSQPHVRCSNCGEYHFAWYRRFPYCPNCGADMRGDKNGQIGEKNSG